MSSTALAVDLGGEFAVWEQDAQRAATSRGYLAELQVWLNLSSLGRVERLPRLARRLRLLHQLAELAQRTDRGIVLDAALIAWFGKETDLPIDSSTSAEDRSRR